MFERFWADKKFLRQNCCSEVAFEVQTRRHAAYALKMVNKSESPIFVNYISTYRSYKSMIHLS